MATAEKGFHIPSEEEIDKLLTDKDSINTQKATKLSVKCFRDYICVNKTLIMSSFPWKIWKFEKHFILVHKWRKNVGLRAIFLIGQIVFSWILILNLFIVVDVIFKFLRQRSNGLLIKYVCQQYLTCMCFLGFIWYNKTFIACGFRKYENLFTHEYHISFGRCPRGIWYSWVNKCSYFPHQHAINV